MQAEEFYPYSPTVDQLKKSVEKVCRDIRTEQEKQETWEWQREINGLKRAVSDLATIVLEILQERKPKPQMHLDCQGNVKGYVHRDGTVSRYPEDE